MFLSLVVLWNNCRGKERRAEKVNVYYTLFAGGFFVFTVIMWVIAAAILQNSKDSGNGKDLWGWSCKDNLRATLFKELVDYALVCRMQVCNTSRSTAHHNRIDILTLILGLDPCLHYY